MQNKTIDEFTRELYSAAPVPGGGGASALMGALSASLCGMVANLTTGKKKYAEYQNETDEILGRAEALRKATEELMSRDAEVFEPLSQAYSLPKDAPGRDEILEKLLGQCAAVPFEMCERAFDCAKIARRLADIGSRLAISDVGVAASAARAAVTGAAMNVYINTKLMKNRDAAEKLNSKTEKLVAETCALCDETYALVEGGLK